MNVGRTPGRHDPHSMASELGGNDRPDRDTPVRHGPRRSWMVVLAAALGMGVVATSLIALRGSGDPARVTLAEESAAASAVTSADATVAVTNRPSPTESAAAAALTGPPSPSRPSASPAADASVVVTASPAEPTAGQQVTITATMHSPGGAPVSSWRVDFGDGASGANSSMNECGPPRHEQVEQFQHTYTAPGKYEVRVYMRASGCGAPAEEATGRLVLLVRA